MNPLRPLPSSSRQIRAGRGRAGQGRGAPAVVVDARFASVSRAPAAPADGSSLAAGESAARVAATSPTASLQAAGESASRAGATSPTLASFQAAGFPAWWTSSSPLGSTEGIYPQGGFTNFVQSNGSPENFHLVGNTRSRTTISPTTPSLKRKDPVESNAQDKETINVDADETIEEEERTERRLNWTKDEDVRLASAWIRHSKDPVEGTDRHGDQYWSDVTKEYNKGTESRFCILRRPARLFEQGDLQNIMIACIILHNMIIEDERDIEQVPLDLNEEGSTYIVEEATITHGENPELEEVLNRNTALHDRQAYKQLQSDLIEHIWQKFGNSYRQNN